MSCQSTYDALFLLWSYSLVQIRYVWFIHSAVEGHLVGSHFMTMCVMALKHWSESLCMAVYGFLFWGRYPGGGLLGQMHFQLFKGWPDCFLIGCTILCSLCSHQPRWRGSLCSHQACWRVPFGSTSLLGGVLFIPNQAPWRGPLCSHLACWRCPFIFEKVGDSVSVTIAILVGVKWFQLALPY